MFFYISIWYFKISVYSIILSFFCNWVYQFIFFDNNMTGNPAEYFFFFVV